MVETIMSGGQTGVDRAALDVARELYLPCGGWCPRGRRAEDGALPAHYPLRETPSPDYAQRTEWNVRDSDGTLVLTAGPPTEGTAYTVEIARRLGKPVLIVDLNEEPSAQVVLTWVTQQGIRRLNVAGPRESKAPGIYRRAQTFLRRLLAQPAT
ncbi:MAG: putative molybdenum carrier protein [Nitrospirales bacterium]